MSINLYALMRTVRGSNIYQLFSMNTLYTPRERNMQFVLKLPHFEECMNRVAYAFFTPLREISLDRIAFSFRETGS